VSLRRHHIILLAVLAMLVVTAATAPAALAAGYVYTGQWGSTGSYAGQFQTPTGVSVDQAGNVWTVNNTNGVVQRFTPGGGFLTFFSAAANNPWGIATDKSGNVYVPDWTSDQIREYDARGTFVRTFGTSGSGAGQLHYPIGLDVTSTGLVYVSDCYNHRVMVFDNAGGFVTSFGSFGTGDGQLKYPSGIEVDEDAGEVYVLENNGHRVSVFTTSGTFQRTFGTFGSGNGQLMAPYGLALTGDGRVAVSDSSNQRVAFFTTDGAWAGSIGSLGSGPGQFNFPADVAVDGDGTLYVADGTNDRIQRFAYDDTPPVMTSDYDGEWHSQPFTVSFTTSDDLPGPIVPSNRYDGGPWLGGLDRYFDANPSTHSFDGIHALEFFAVDNAANESAVRKNWIKIDTRRPKTVCDQVRDGGELWSNDQLALTFSATDVGSGVNATYTSVNGGPETVVPDEGLVLDTEGAYDVAYFSADNCTDAANVEPMHHATVTIDFMGPTAKPLNSVTVTRYKSAGFKYSVTDNLASTVTAKIVIKKKSKVVKTVSLGSVSTTGSTVTKSIKIGLAAGVYNWTVVAYDPAGNMGSYAPRKLTVK
jgi:sugar lactone lactonase YvrE